MDKNTTEIWIGAGLLLLSDVKKVKDVVMRFTDNIKFFRILKSKASCEVLKKDPMNSWIRKELTKTLTFQ